MNESAPTGSRDAWGAATRREADAPPPCGSDLDATLRAELERLERLGLRRELARGRADGLVDFRSNDTLSLSTDARVIAAARAALERHGAGARASRLLGGDLDVHARAESAAAAWLGAEAALAFPSAYQANLGVLTVLAGRGDELYCDELVHASIVDAARLSRASVRVFRHGDSAHLEGLLGSGGRPGARRVVAVESIYSMDGDLADLAALHEVCARHGAWLVVDEAHACGLLGPRGAGAWAAHAASGARGERLAARIVAGGKALGASGAFAVGSRVLVDLLVQRARPFVFSTGLAPASAGALEAAIGAAIDADAARAHVLALARALATALELPAPAAAIVPVHVGAAGAATELRDQLAHAGFAVGAARPPTVPPGKSRLRVALHAHNTAEQVERLARELGRRRPERLGAMQLCGPPRLARVLTVVGTDTNVGKTVVSALLVAALRRAGRVRYWKPVQTGTDSDTLTVSSLAALARHERAEPLHSFALPASPHTAAAAAGARIDPDAVLAHLLRLRRELGEGTLVVELAGGLLVPLDEHTTQAELLARADAELVLVARSGLGTLNHTLLTLEALRARSLEPRALFLVGEPHAANRATLAARAGVAHVHEVPLFEPLDARAIESWVDAHPLEELTT